jgi:hypothetical protein
VEKTDVLQATYQIPTAFGEINLFIIQVDIVKRDFNQVKSQLFDFLTYIKALPGLENSY